MDIVTNWLNREYMENILRSFYADSHLTVNNVNVYAASADDNNPLEQIIRIKVDFDTSKLNDTIVWIIGKVKTSSKLTQDFAKRSVNLFEREFLCFKILLPNLLEIIKINKIADVVFPLGIHLDSENSIILMEDLKSRNFEQHPPRKYLNLKQMELVMDALADLHGASYYAIKENPELKNIFNGHILNGKYSRVWDAVASNADVAFKKHIEKYNIPEIWKERLSNIRKRLDMEWFKVYDRQEGKLNFIIHGDVWQNNMMFHFINGEPDEVILIDYEMANYNSFANDLMQAVFTSLESTLILSKLDQLLHRYFCRLLKVAPDIPNLSLELVRNEFEERYYLGYLMMLFNRPILVSSIEPNFDEMMDGKRFDLGYDSQLFVDDIKKLIPFFEKTEHMVTMLFL